MPPLLDVAAEVVGTDATKAVIADDRDRPRGYSRRRSVFIEQPRTAQVSARERSRSVPMGSVFVMGGIALVTPDAGQLPPVLRNEPAAGQARSARGVEETIAAPAL